MSAGSSRVLVVGYGEMGHAMECLLAARHELAFHDILPVAGRARVDPEQAAARADFVIYCVPAVPLAGLAQRFSPLLAPHCISLSVAKGLDEAGRTAAGIFREACSGRHGYGVIYGPMIAEEIRAGKAAFAQVGVSRSEDFAGIAGLFAGTALALEYATDLTGLGWAAVLKNVYALLFGAADGLQLGDNVRGYLTVAALQEMAGIIGRLGGDSSTARQLCGLGDLVTTATSAGSHHHALGRRLVCGDRTDLRGEGVHTLAMLRAHRLVDPAEYPLLALAERLLDETEDPAALLRALRPAAAH